METRNLSKKVDKVFTECFGKHPLKVRLDDISNEFYELVRFRDKNNLKEETGDLLSSIFQLCNEFGWNPETLITTTLDKINKRKLQYKTLKKTYKIAILGGAFNPVTEAHIQVAEFVLNSTKLFDEVWIMPCYSHIYGKDMVSPKHRINMCELAIAHNPKIKVFNYEIKNKFSGKTYDLFHKLLNDDMYKDNHEFYMIIGMDNANSITKWYNHKKLIKLLNFIVVPRKGIVRKNNINWYLKSPHIFLDFANQMIECSSTEVRKMLKNKEFSDLDKLGYLNKDVLKYIENNNLYK
jgi:nicotinate-nucleotide adenylyltransferase